MVKCKSRKCVCSKTLKDCISIEACNTPENIVIESDSKEESKRLMEVLKNIIMMEIKLTNLIQQVQIIQKRIDHDYQ